MSFINTGGIPPGSLTDVTTEAKWDLGKVVWSEDGKGYRYVQFADAVAVLKGHVMCYDAAGNNIVTNDVSEDADSNLAAGVALAAVATNTTSPQYGFVQVSGHCDTIITDENVSDGDFLIPGTADGAAHTMSAGEEHKVFAVASAADSGAVGAGWLRGIL
tara:strand:- start:7706 stop:8185 length:480 start_codon:yes stop_codon:yes gene_type:complete